jgi:hypothetical protein
MALIIISLLVIVPLALLVWDTARRSNGNAAATHAEAANARPSDRLHGSRS